MSNLLPTAAVLPLLLDTLVKGTLLLLLVFAAARWPLRRASAATRHVLWASCLAGLIALPVLSAVLPAWRVMSWLPGQAAPQPFVFLPDAPAPPEIARGPQQLPRMTAIASLDVTPDPVRPAAPAVEAMPPAESTPTYHWLTIVWFIGVSASVLWLLGGLWSVMRLERRCPTVTAGPLLERTMAIAKQLRIRRPIRLRVSAERTIPMTWGIWRPTVLLPEAAATWTSERQRMVLTHELAHVQRWDCLVQMFAHLVRGLYWFHPLVWLAVWRLRTEQEYACDDAVLDAGASPPDYADHLLAVTAASSGNLWTAPVALAMSRQGRLHSRLTTLLDLERDHRPLRRRTLLAGTVGVFALAMMLAMLTVGQAPAIPVQMRNARLLQNAGKDSDLLKKLAEVQDKLAKHHVAPVDEKTLTEHALKGLLQSLNDPYTDYLSANELNHFDMELKGKVTGIGVQLKLIDQRLTVLSPVEESPALKAGLRPGDVIDTIDGKSTHGITLVDAVARILGAPGSVVKLKVVHPEGVVQELAITRAEVRFRTTGGFQRDADGKWQFMLDADHKIGYLDIHSFGARTAAEVRATIVDLQKQGIKGLILDLRSCPGGFLEQAIEICKLFLDKGVILTTKGPGKAETVFKADGKTTLGDFPLLVLINEQTASAAEIVAGSLRDHDRAILLGTRTFGKGSVQSIMKLDAGGALKVTTALHYLPSGRNIQKRPGASNWGVDPSDGYYLPITAAQSEALHADVQKRGLLGLKKDELPKLERLTPRIIEEKHADPQLAAGLRSMVARLTGGEFLKVGKDKSLFLDQTQQIEELRQRREQLQKNLQQLDHDITNLQRGAAKTKE